MRRVIGMDVHRTFAEVVVWEDGRLRPLGRVDMTVRRRMVWDSGGLDLMEGPAHLDCEVRRLGSGAASGVAGWSAA